MNCVADAYLCYGSYGRGGEVGVSAWCVSSLPKDQSGGICVSVFIGPAMPTLLALFLSLCLAGVNAA